jgi:hypothetical protein
MEMKPLLASMVKVPASLVVEAGSPAIRGRVVHIIMATI